MSSGSWVWSPKSLRSRSATVAAGRPAKMEQMGPSKSRSRWRVAGNDDVEVVAL